MSLVHLKCFKCGKLTELVDRVGLRDECEHCRSDAHCCRNCLFYDAKAYNECRESSADVVKDKERANFCDYFQLGQENSRQTPLKEDLLAAAEALFKKK